MTFRELRNRQSKKCQKDVHWKKLIYLMECLQNKPTIKMVVNKLNWDGYIHEESFKILWKDILLNMTI